MEGGTAVNRTGCSVEVTERMVEETKRCAAHGISDNADAYEVMRYDNLMR